MSDNYSRRLEQTARVHDNTVMGRVTPTPSVLPPYKYVSLGSQHTPAGQPANLGTPVYERSFWQAVADNVMDLADNPLTKVVAAAAALAAGYAVAKHLDESAGRPQAVEGQNHRGE